MSNLCEALHKAIGAATPLKYPFSAEVIPSCGIYIMLEVGEEAHGTHRIVRVGTHTGTKSTLGSRLEDHYVRENKDRSIFRKNIGRAMLARSGDPFLEDWNKDLTSRKARQETQGRIDLDQQAEVERRVTEYIRSRIFVVPIPMASRDGLGKLERSLIATIAQCRECSPSAEWLGNWSPQPKIRHSGLWQEQGVESAYRLDVETVNYIASVLRSGG
jgi:hypothetical protein